MELSDGEIITYEHYDREIFISRTFLKLLEFVDFWCTICPTLVFRKWVEHKTIDELLSGEKTQYGPWVVDSLEWNSDNGTGTRNCRIPHLNSNSGICFGYCLNTDAIKLIIWGDILDSLFKLS